ncbi:MAG: UbiA family prenyltransferase [Armatimonadota bacterium]
MQSRHSAWKDYVQVARPDHWFKNLFMLVGFFLCIPMEGVPLSAALVYRGILGLALACLTASGNYILNELIDAPMDRAHPKKRHRPVASGRAKRWPLGVGMVLLPLVAAGIGHVALGAGFSFWTAVFWLAAVAYNVRPLRFKEVAVLDGITESANNPIRLMLGWYAASAHAAMPPMAMVIAFWSLGAFLMTAKRFAELRALRPEQAKAYRRSFHWYSERRLLLMMVTYISAFMCLAVVLALKCHPEWLLALPFGCIFVGWFLHLAAEPDSIVQEPERVTERPAFVAYSFGLFVLVVLLSAAQWPALRHWLGMPGTGW